MPPAVRCFRLFRLATGWLMALVGLLAAGSTSASGDYFPPTFYSLSDGNTYSLFQPAYAQMSVPFLTPANDSRITLMLLLADARHVRPHSLTRPTAFGRHGRYVAQTPIDFDTFTAVFDKPRPAPRPDAQWNFEADRNDGTYVDGLGDRCRSSAASAAGYLSALKASSTPPWEQSRLASARTALTVACAAGTQGVPVRLASGAITSAAGQDFAAYLTAASAFYAGDLATARAYFSALGGNAQPWIREAARYTVGRLDLNLAEANGWGQYGDLALKNIDLAALARAESEFQAYLRAYPAGAYAASARGFQRRVLWLRGDKPRLAKLYEQAFDDKSIADNVSIIDLTYEIDDKLLTGARLADIPGPRLLATLDLTQMRVQDGHAATLTRADLDAQAPLFAAQPELYSYLRAAYSFYVDNRPADALTTLAAVKAGPRMSYVRFSAEVLKGLALEALHRPVAARAHWLAVMPFTEPVLQRSVVELALAQNYEKSGDVAAVFATGSPIHNPTYRELLLSHSASPDLLRARATADDAPVHERQLALYVLLFKELTRGRYQAFVDDWHLMPDPVPTRTYGDKLQIGRNNPPALIDFARFGVKTPDDYHCPDIATVATVLAAQPHDEASLICVGEFLRLYGYDGFLRQDNPPVQASSLPEPPGPPELSAVATQFPGVGVSRLDLYKTIIKDQGAADDVRAYALYRAVSCWAPSGDNHCDDTVSSLDQHRQWYHELKTRYPTSPWANRLKFYW